MKKSIWIALLSTGMILGASSAQAQHFYVNVRPTARVVTRPSAPSPRHVWVASEWAWSNGNYVETPGHWDLPPRGRRTWVAGHWTRERRGNYWVAGHWR